MKSSDLSLIRIRTQTVCVVIMCEFTRASSTVVSTSLKEINYKDIINNLNIELKQIDSCK